MRNFIRRFARGPVDYLTALVTAFLFGVLFVAFGYSVTTGVGVAVFAALFLCAAAWGFKRREHNQPTRR